MKDRKLDENGDMTFGSGLDNYFIDSAEAVAQSVLTRLRMWTIHATGDITSGTVSLQNHTHNHGPTPDK